MDPRGCSRGQGTSICETRLRGSLMTTQIERLLHVVTGPSGAGKSSFCKQQADWEHRLYNLDWARLRGGVHDSAARERAWREIVGELRGQMEAEASPIALDHILDTGAIEEVIEPARAYGYRVHLTIVCPGGPDICIARVARRRREGGHGRSPATIRQLYDDALLVAAEASATRTVAFRQRFLAQPKPSCHPVGIRPACAVRSPTGC